MHEQRSAVQPPAGSGSLLPWTRPGSLGRQPRKAAQPHAEGLQQHATLSAKDLYFTLSKAGLLSAGENLGQYLRLDPQSFHMLRARVVPAWKILRHGEHTSGHTETPTACICSMGLPGLVGAVYSTS